jgi:hypothetical protein
VAEAVAVVSHVLHMVLRAQMVLAEDHRIVHGLVAVTVVAVEVQQLVHAHHSTDRLEQEALDLQQAVTDHFQLTNLQVEQVEQVAVTVELADKVETQMEPTVVQV